jgi:alkyl sulfatase BDS1-like metallo-beta-lactamase superfamily hydrolase
MSSVNHREHLNDLPFADTADFADTANTDRGFIAALEPFVVKAGDGTSSNT